MRGERKASEFAYVCVAVFTYGRVRMVSVEAVLSSCGALSSLLESSVGECVKDPAK